MQPESRLSVAEANSFPAELPGFAGIVLPGLATLVGCDVLTYNEIGPAESETSYEQTVPGTLTEQAVRRCSSTARNAACPGASAASRYLLSRRQDVSIRKSRDWVCQRAA